MSITHIENLTNYNFNLTFNNLNNESNFLIGSNFDVLPDLLNVKLVAPMSNNDEDRDGDGLINELLITSLTSQLPISVADSQNIANNGVFVSRGSSTFQNKADQLSNAGAKLMILYNTNDLSYAMMPSIIGNLPIISISNKNGQNFVYFLRQNNNLYLSVCNNVVFFHTQQYNSLLEIANLPNNFFVNNSGLSSDKTRLILFNTINLDASFLPINYEYKSFPLSDLSNVNLNGINLTGIDLSGSNLTGVISGGIIGTPLALPINWKLINGYLIGPKANLSGANLTEANLTGANLSNANLTYVNLSNANLTDANLTGANLTEANLLNTNLSNANLTNISAINVVGIPKVLPKNWYLINGQLINNYAYTDENCDINVKYTIYKNIENYGSPISILPNTDDQYSNVINLNFSFNYFNKIYKSISLSTNGRLIFGDKIDETHTYYSGNVIYPSILACLTDLVTTQNGIKYISNSDKFIVEWVVALFDYQDKKFKFQIHLSSDNKINIYYNNALTLNNYSYFSIEFFTPSKYYSFCDNQIYKNARKTYVKLPILQNVNIEYTQKIIDNKKKQIISPNIDIYKLPIRQTYQIKTSSSSGLTYFLYASTNNKIATIDASGKITTLNEGKFSVQIYQPGNDKYEPEFYCLPFFIDVFSGYGSVQ